MGLETGTYISDLNAANPVGASDPKSQGDNHIRLVKSTLLATFPNITGAVTLTHTQLNNALVKTESSTVSGSIEVTDTAGDNLGAIRIVRAFPVLGFHETGAAANEGKWQLGVFSSVLDFRSLDDAETGSVSALRIVRGSGTAVSEFEVNATTIDLNGNLDLNGTVDLSSTVQIGDTLTLANTTPRLRIHETDATANEGEWLWVATGDILFLGSATDAAPTTLDTSAMRFRRSGTAITDIELIASTEIDLTATTIDINGGLDVSGTIDVANGIALRCSATDSSIRSDGDNKSLTIIGGNQFSSATNCLIRIYGPSHVGLPDYIQLHTPSGGTIQCGNAGATATVELNATTIDINGNVDISGTVVTADNLTIGATSRYGWASDADTYMYRVGADEIRFTVGGVTLLNLQESTTDVVTLGAAGATLTFTGNVSNANTAASEVGRAGAPSRDVSATGNTAASDMGGTIRFTSSGFTFTLDADPPEDAVVILDNAGGGNVTLAASTTLIWATTGGTGNRTLADDSLCVALHRGGGVWIVNGGGIT